MSWSRRDSKQRTRLKAAVLAAHGPYCWWCGSQLGEVWDADHVLPVALGGTDDLDNLRPAHIGCNRGRGLRPRKPTLIRRRPW